MIQRGGSFGEGEIQGKRWGTVRRDELTRQWGQKAKERGLTGPTPGNKICLPWQKDQAVLGWEDKVTTPLRPTALPELFAGDLT